MSSILPGVLGKPQVDPTAGPLFLATDFGFKAWSHDSSSASQNALPPSGNIRLVGIKLTQTFTLTTVYFGMVTQGSGYTANQNKAGIYNASGALLQSVDMTTPLSGATNGNLVTVSGFSTSVTAGTTIYIAYLVNATSAPTIVGSSSAAQVFNNYKGASVVPARWMLANATGQTSLSSFNPWGSFVQPLSTQMPHWAAVS